jgi:hypothetical protein
MINVSKIVSCGTPMKMRKIIFGLTLESHVSL